MKTDIYLVRADAGNKIQQRRKDLGMRQQDLADEIGLTRVTISNIETGKFSTTVDNLVLIADALQCDLRDLLPVIRRKT